MSPIHLTDGHRAKALQLAGSSETPPPAAADIEALVHATIYVGDQVARLADAVENACKIGGALDQRRSHTIPVERGSA